MKGPATSFILELPTYKIPQASQVARQVWTNSKQFLTKAGTTIFCLSVILWALMYYPKLPQSKVDSVESRTRADSQSYWKMALPQLHAPPTAEERAKAEQAAIEKAVAGEQLR